MQQVLNLLSQIVFPTAVIGVFWFVSFLVVTNLFGNYFNSYILAGFGWLSLFSTVIAFVLLLSVKIAFSSQFFTLISIFAFCMASYNIFRKPSKDLGLSKVGIFSLAFSAFLSVLFIVNNWGNRFAGSSFASLGTLHTGKYAYLSEFMSDCRKLPRINNNLGQSIVTAFFSTPTRGTATFLLLVILSFTFLALASIGYGLFIQYFPDSRKRDRIYALFIFLMGNYALSLAVPIVNDSGNPLILVGYSDTLISVLYFLVLIEILRRRFQISFGRKMVLLVPGTLALWVSSPQTLVLIPIACLYLIYKKSLKDAFLIFVSFLLSIATWRNQSGMLASLSESITIPGINSELTTVGKPGSLTELISPGFPYVVNSINLQNSPLEIAPKGIDLFKSIVSEGRFINGFPILDPERLFWYLEQIVLTTLRPVFWPVLGILFTVILVSRRIRTHLLPRMGELQMPASPVYVLATMNLLITFPLSFLVQLDGRKWEMTRFSFLNWAVGMYLVAIIYLVLKREKRHRVARMLLILTVPPTLIHIVLKISTNVPDLAFQLDTPLGIIGVVNEVISANCSN